MTSLRSPSKERQKRTYWYRCSRLLIEGSLAILKEFLKNHCKGQLEDFLKNNYEDLNKLRGKRILSQDQMNQLFPHADLESLDITLITCILLNCQPKLQPSQDQSLINIRDLRNVLFAHISSLSLEENEFNNNWELIRNCLSNAETVLGVNTCLHEFIDEVREEEIGNIKRFRDELNAWKCSDDKILSEILKKQTEDSRKLDDVAENVEKMNARLTKLFKGEGDEVNEEVTDEVWKELQHCLMNDYKKFLLRAPITAIESLSYETDIDDIYAEPKLLVVDHTALTKETCNKNQKPITPKDIFPSKRNKCSNIYVTGDAGMGKTSLCKYILSAWCKAHQKGETGKNDFVLALEQYDFAFYISLRHAIGQDYMKDMIVSQCLKHIDLNTNTKLRGFQREFLLNEVLRLKYEKCLIILDGLDEWRLSENVPSENVGIPLRDPHLNYTILTTTRPWKLEQLRLKESRIDKQVKVTGVEDTKIFAEKMIWCYNEREKRNETYHNFIQCLKDKHLTELSKTPILLKHLVCLWFSNESFGKSKTEIYTNMIELWLQNAEKRKDVKHLFSSREDIHHNIERPNVFKKSGKCDQYTALLKAVGKLAYVTATQEEVIQLAFDSTDEHEISEDQIKICLDVGILTQSIVPDMTCERKSISFPHKTFHEFFAALYMGWHYSEQGVMTCKTKGLIEYERKNMCIFLSAIWPSVFESLIEVFYKNKSKDKIEVVYKKTEDEYVQDLLLNCCCESIAANNHCPKVDFKFMSLHGPDFAKKDSEDKMLVVLSKMFDTKILRPNMIGDAVDLSGVTCLQHLNIHESEFESLVVSPCLRYLKICQVDIITPEGIVGLMSSIAKAKKLKRLQICKFNKNSKSIVTLDLSNNKNLSSLFLQTMYANKLSVSLNITELSLCNFHLASHEEIVSTMKKMSNLTKLKRLILLSVYCSEHRSHRKCFLDVDLSETSTLSEIRLRNVSFSTLSVSPAKENTTIQNVYLASHKDLFLLMKHVTYLTRYYLANRVYCCEHSSQRLDFSWCKDESSLQLSTYVPHSQCFLDVDLSQNSALTTIDVHGVSFSKLRVSPNLANLTFRDIQLASHEDIVTLMRNVSNLTKLYSLSLRNVYCSEHKSHSHCFLDVDLSQNSTLATIEVHGVSFSKLSVSPTTEKLTFHDIQLPSHEDIVSLMTNVANLTKRTFLSLRNVYCSEHKSHSQCFLDVDLSQNSTLRTIEFQGVSFSKLSVSPTTQKLTFNDIQLASHEDILSLMTNVTNLKKLYSLSLRNVYCSEHKSHSQCFLDVDLSLNSRQTNIEVHGVPFSKLSVSPATEKLTLNDIQLASHEDIVSLMTNVTNLTKLSRFSMRNVYCCEHKSHSQCFLDVDLSQNSARTTIDVHGVSFSKLSVSPNLAVLTFHDIQLASHEDIVSLMTNVSNLTKLYCLSLRNVYCSEHKSHSQCFLDVDLSQNSTLRTIDVHGVSFSKLSVSPNLANLTFHDIQLASHEDILSLMTNVTNLTKFYSLSLRNVYCSEHKSHLLCFLDVDFLQNSTLTTIKVHGVSFSKLSVSTNLAVLTFHDIQAASHEDIVTLMTNVTKLTKLYRWSLRNVYCSEHKSHSQCFLDVDLLQTSTLTTIEFQGVSFSKLSVSPATEKLTFHDIQLASHEKVVSLMKNVTNLTTLQFLSMSKVYCSEHKSHLQCFLDVDLSQSTFPNIYFKDLFLSKLVLSRSTTTVFKHMFQTIQYASNEAVAFFLSEKRKTDSSLSLADAAANAAYAVSAAAASAAAAAADYGDDDGCVNDDDKSYCDCDNSDVHYDYDDDDNDEKE